MFKLMDKKIIAILRKLFFLNWPYAYLEINGRVDVNFSLFPCITLCPSLCKYRTAEIGSRFQVHIEIADMLTVHIIPERETKCSR